MSLQRPGGVEASRWTKPAEGPAVSVVVEEGARVSTERPLGPEIPITHPTTTNCLTGRGSPQYVGPRAGGWASVQP